MGKHYYAWVRVGDGQPEPAAVKRVDGVRKVFTIGCPDGFDLGRGSAIKLGDKLEPDYDFLTPEEQTREDKLAERRQAAYRKLNPLHGYAGFGRLS